MPKTTITYLVEDGEALRADLLALLHAASPAEVAVLVTELIVFYGQAFRVVKEALAQWPAEDATANIWRAKIFHECVCGAAAFTVWQRQLTPLNDQAVCGQLSERWRKIAHLVETAE